LRNALATSALSPEDSIADLMTEITDNDGLEL